MDDTVLRGCRLLSGESVDVSIDGATIATVDPSAGPTTRDDASVVGSDTGSAEGWLLLRSAVEPHAHLDKAFLADDVDNETGDLHGAIEAMERARPRLGRAETAARAERALRQMAANGYRAVRTHVDVTTGNGLVSLEALTDVRQRLGALIDVEIVALSGFPVTGGVGAPQRELLAAAISAGADLIGGCPHLERFAVEHAGDDDGDAGDARSRAATETYLELAAAAGIGVDLHTDETLDPRDNGLRELAELVTATGFEGRVTASHCVNLAMRPEAEQRAVAEAVAAAGIGVIALPATNLYLQGREHRQGMPRGLTAVRALLDAGVAVAAGADNVQDPFNPLGRFSPFETAALMVLVAHLSPHEAWASVTDGAAAVLGVDSPLVAPGTPADLIGVRASSLRQAIAGGGCGATVWRHGRRLDLAPA